ncbi:MAG: arginine--tRNA ligase [Thermoplasmata archaeon]|nr:MAG: arginine--tRNA ligase [Thermoplasmata archaeon]
MQPFELFRNEAIAAIEEAISTLYGIPFEKKELEKPPEEMGDIAFPCFSLAKFLKKNPSEIAKEIFLAIQKKEKKWISRVECKGGYVNFFINEQKLAEFVIKDIIEKKDEYGSLPSKNKKVIVEHTSANPNGPLHVGRARNPIIGDTLARILKFAGYDVETQFYVDDMGKQVATLFWGVKNLDIEIRGEKDDHKLVPFYQEASRLLEKDEKVKEEIEEIIRKCEAGDEKILKEIRKVYEKVLNGMMQSLHMLNISIDTFVTESRFVLDGSVKNVIEKLKKTEFANVEENAIYLDVEHFGIHGRNKKFFLTRRDGTSLYATRDIAYHIWKGKQADMLVNILGEDHKLEAKLVEIALNLLGEKIPTVVFYSFVSLPEGKMSTRKGRVVYLDDLIEEAIERAYQEVKKRRDLDEKKARYISQKVGIGAIRYNIIKVKPEKAIVFTWEDALNFEGQSAPFIQYAHARCCSILKKAEGAKVQSFSYEHVQEKALIKTISLFPEVVKECAESYNPSILAEYAHSLAASFNAFYRDCRVLGGEREKERLALVYATKCVLKNALTLLGIEALEEM